MRSRTHARSVLLSVGMRTTRMLSKWQKTAESKSGYVCSKMRFPLNWAGLPIGLFFSGIFARKKFRKLNIEVGHTSLILQCEGGVGTYPDNLCPVYFNTHPACHVNAGLLFLIRPKQQPLGLELNRRVLDVQLPELFVNHSSQGFQVGDVLFGDDDMRGEEVGLALEAPDVELVDALDSREREERVLDVLATDVPGHSLKDDVERLLEVLPHA